MSRKTTDRGSSPPSAFDDDPFAPRANPDLTGHAEAEQRLLDAYNSGRLHHAWLIGGPPGIGKATLAFRFARFLLARGDAVGGRARDLAPGPGHRRQPPPAASPSPSSPPSPTGGGLFDLSMPPSLPLPSSPPPSRPLATPAGALASPPSRTPAPLGPATSLALEPTHPVFCRVKASGHADLLTIERRFDEKKGKMKQDIAVEDVRRIAQFLHLTAGEGLWRVAIIDGADRMNSNGFNAVLKILEEPPPGAVLMLVSDNPGAMLPTIRSRCRALTLQALPETTVRTLIGRYRPTVPEGDTVPLARLADGSIGRALALADAGGLTLYREIVDLVATLPRLDWIAVHGFADRLAKRGDETLYATASTLLVAWFERFVRGAAAGTLPAAVVPGEDALMRRLATEHGLDRWLEVWEKVSRLFARAEAASLDHKQAVLDAFAGMEAVLS